MKQKEVLVIGVAAFITAIFSIIISGALFGSPKNNPIKVPVVYKISPTFPDLSNDDNYKPIFNSKALDPTQPIKIQQNNNSTPFNGTSSQ